MIRQAFQQLFNPLFGTFPSDILFEYWFHRVHLVRDEYHEVCVFQKSAVWTNSFFAINTNNFKFLTMSWTHVYSEHEFLFSLLGRWLCYRLWSGLYIFLFLLLCFIFISHFNHGKIFRKLFSFFLPSNRSPRNEIRN